MLMTYLLIFSKQINKLNQETLNGKDLSDKEFDRLLTKIGGKVPSIS